MPQKHLYLRVNERVLDMILIPISQGVSMQASNGIRGHVVDGCSGPIHVTMDLLTEISDRLALRLD